MWDSCRAAVLYVWKEQENTRSQWLNSKCNGCICLSSAWCAPEEFVIPAFSATWLSNEAFLTLAPHLFPLQFLFYSVSYSHHFNSASFQLAIPPEKRWNDDCYCTVKFFVLFSILLNHIASLSSIWMVKSLWRREVVMGSFFFCFALGGYERLNESPFKLLIINLFIRCVWELKIPRT